MTTQPRTSQALRDPFDGDDALARVRAYATDRCWIVYRPYDGVGFGDLPDLILVRAPRLVLVEIEQRRKRNLVGLDAAICCDAVEFYRWGIDDWSEIEAVLQ